MNEIRKYNRQSMRLKGYDYLQIGMYFITICTQNRLHLFGSVKNGKMILNNAGQIAKKYLLLIPDHFPHAKLDEYAIMPDHIHFIIEINVVVNNYLSGNKNNHNQLEPEKKNNTESDKPLESNRNNNSTEEKWVNNYLTQPGTSKTVGSIVRGFKIGVTKWFREETTIRTVWQRNYYDHIIHNENEYNRISNYIKLNPQKWQDHNINDKI